MFYNKHPYEDKKAVGEIALNAIKQIGQTFYYQLIQGVQSTYCNIKDNDANVVGIVTVEDILEDLVGEIYDEDDIGGDFDA